MKYTIKLMDDSTETIYTSHSPTMYSNFIWFGEDYLVSAALVKVIKLIEGE